MTTPQSFLPGFHKILARSSIWRFGLPSVVALCAHGAWAQEAVPVLQTTEHKVTQVVVGGNDGQTYVTSTLQALNSDVVLITPAMAQAAKPFSVATQVFTPVESLAQVPANVPVAAASLPISPGRKEVHTHSFNSVYEVIYQHNGRWMAVETSQAPENGMLVLTDQVKKASRTLWTS